MKPWSTACPDWEDRVVNRQSLVPVQPIFQDQADDALDVFCHLRMVDAHGSPLMGETCLPWVLDLVAALFGSYDAQARRRLITNYFLMVSKKNGKSTIAAGIMLTALILNTRASGEFIILAPTKEAADNAYKPIRDMINADEDLQARFHEQEYHRLVTDRLNKATLKVVAADAATVTGKKAIGVFIDELWEFGKQAKAASMLTEATGGITSRPEGFIFYCTTQSDAPPAGVFKAKLEYARKVRDGEVRDDRFLPVIYEFPRHMLEQKAHRDLSNAYITNPNWGVSVDEDVIRQKYQEAQEGGEEQVRDFLAKHMNVEIGLNLRADRWAGADFWEAQTVEALTLQSLLDQSEAVTIGIDGGGLDDLLGLTVLGRKTGADIWLSYSLAWAHPIALERRKSEESKYRDFEKDGDLVIIKELPGDVAAVADIVEMIDGTGLLAGIGMDPEKTHKVMLEELLKRKIDEKIIFGIPQGWKLVGAISIAERRLAERKLFHAPQPMMNWCVGNARIESRANSVLITKQASGTAKIDPVMALLNAVELMNTNPSPPGKKYQMFFLNS